VKICMLVFNSGTRDGRVMREAHSLRAAGFDVQVVGVPEPDAMAAVETLPDGVTVHRLDWRPVAQRRAQRTAILRLLPVLLLLGLAAYGLCRLTGAALFFRITSKWVVTSGPAAWFGVVVAMALLLVGAYFAAKQFRGWISVLATRAAQRNQSATRVSKRGRPAPIIGLVGGRPFPELKSRIPSWLPEFILETLAEPFHAIGGRVGRFVLYRYRAEVMAEFLINLRPDVLHCHDCVALPTGILVKKALGIPLIYDAHEIYEAAATTRLGITDYYARIHERCLGKIDGFVTINQCAADYYRQAYPGTPPALIIRNAANAVSDFAYDGRLHKAANLPFSEKILLYHGGFTAHRGLPILVRAGALLPAGWSLVLMGWGPLNDELRIIANEANHPEKVKFLPGVPLSELHLWSAGGTVGIIPYENNVLNHWICTPNKLWEFPVAGVPLIVQPFPELRKVVETYNCGWVLPENLTPHAIVDLIARLTDEDIARARQGCAQFIAQDNWESAYETRLVEYYRALEVVRVQDLEIPKG